MLTDELGAQVGGHRPVLGQVALDPLGLALFVGHGPGLPFEGQAFDRVVGHHDGVGIGGEVARLPGTRRAGEREAVLVVIPDAPHRQGVRTPVTRDRDDPEVPVGAQPLGGP